jgi:hypothetical protein
MRVVPVALVLVAHLISQEIPFVLGVPKKLTQRPATLA